MQESVTALGRVKVGAPSELFAEAATLAVARFVTGGSRPFVWALSGGSTPQAWYRWCVAHGAIPPAVAAGARFTVSDERWVSPESPDSNFGNAARLLLDPVAVPAAHRLPWPVGLAPDAAAEAYTQEMVRLAGAGRAYDVCLLGLGDDAHTASLFPGSLLLGSADERFFATVEVPAKGRRGTITPAGLRACGLVVLLVTGAGKAGAIRRVFRGNEAPTARSEEHTSELQSH